MSTIIVIDYVTFASESWPKIYFLYVQNICISYIFKEEMQLIYFVNYVSLSTMIDRVYIDSTLGLSVYLLYLPSREKEKWEI